MILYLKLQILQEFQLFLIYVIQKYDFINLILNILTIFINYFQFY